MSDLVLKSGDQALFLPAFGAAVVVVMPGVLTGSGPLRVGGANACVAGDEASVSVPGCVYMTPQYSIPGSGTLSIERLAGDQLAATTSSGGKALMVKGSQFTARFQVAAPAMQPPPGPGSPIPDSSPSYSGSGLFLPTTMTVTAG
jgi:hypothetical protein